MTKILFFGTEATLEYVDGVGYLWSCEDPRLLGYLNKAQARAEKLAYVTRHTPAPELVYAQYIVESYPAEILSHDDGHPNGIDTTDVFPPEE